jgi:uncharacterized protein (DUF1697 family)
LVWGAYHGKLCPDDEEAGTMTDRHVALIRGINVGKAKRVAMADLRAALEALGYTDVKTLLNSGNVVFTAGVTPGKAAAQIEEALAKTIGVPARVTVITAKELATAMDENPLLEIADNHSRLFVAVLANPADLSKLKPLTKETWDPEVLALGKRVAYVWCPDGLLESPLSVAVGRALGDGVTSRNWATMLKIRAAL